MKYWWLKKYKGLKIKQIPDLTNDINTYFIMPKYYKERYLAIKDSDIETLAEEDIRILLYCLLNHEKIKNNKVILLLDKLLEIPDNSLPSTNYSLEEIQEEIRELKKNIPTEEKLSSNNVAACYHCLQVFYIDKIKYINKKGHCLCPYCKSSTIYFDNDFIPMDENFLRLSKLFYGVTPLGCNYKNIQKLIKKCIKIKTGLTELKEGAIILKGDKKDTILEDNHVKFQLEEIQTKKTITSKEEMQLHYTLSECFHIIEKNLITKVTIDTSIVNKNYTLYLTLLTCIIEKLGQNPYLKEITLLCPNQESKKIFKNMIETLLQR